MENICNPQLENGYTSIANEIISHFKKYRLSGEEWQVLWVILGKTYGFHKKEDVISISQFNKETGMKKPSIIRAIKKLAEKNIVSKKANGKIPAYRFNKVYKEWKPLAKKLTVNIVSNNANTVSKKANESLAKKLPTKEIKETITKETLLRNGESGFGKPEINQIIAHLKEQLRLPKLDESEKVNRQFAQLLLNKAEGNLAGVLSLIDVTATDDWYKNNITSTKNLFYNAMKIMARKRGKQNERPIISFTDPKLNPTKK